MTAKFKANLSIDKSIYRAVTATEKLVLYAHILAHQLGQTAPLKDNKRSIANACICEIPGVHKVLPLQAINFLDTIFSEQHCNVMMNFAVLSQTVKHNTTLEFEDIVLYDGADWWVPNEQRLAEDLTRQFSIHSINVTGKTLWLPVQNEVARIHAEMGNTVDAQLASDTTALYASLKEELESQGTNPLSFAVGLLKSMREESKAKGNVFNLDDILNPKPQQESKPAVDPNDIFQRNVKKDEDSDDTPDRKSIMETMREVLSKQFPDASVHHLSELPDDIRKAIMNSNPPEFVKKALEASKQFTPDSDFLKGMAAGFLGMEPSELAGKSGPLSAAAASFGSLSHKAETPEGKTAVRAAWHAIDSALNTLGKYGIHGFATKSKHGEGHGTVLLNFDSSNFPDANEFSKCLAEMCFQHLPGTLNGALSAEDAAKAKEITAIYAKLVLENR